MGLISLLLNVVMAMEAPAALQTKKESYNLRSIRRLLPQTHRRYPARSQSQTDENEKAPRLIREPTLPSSITRPAHRAGRNSPEPNPPHGALVPSPRRLERHARLPTDRSSRVPWKAKAIPWIKMSPLCIALVSFLSVSGVFD